MWFTSVFIPIKWIHNQTASTLHYQQLQAATESTEIHLEGYVISHLLSDISKNPTIWPSIMPINYNQR